MRCAKCGTEGPEQARFCRACGARLREGGEAPEQLGPEERARQLLEDAFRLSEEGRVLAAIDVCRQAVTLNPRSTSAHSLLGTLYERQGDRQAAIREYEQVLAISPGSTAERRRLNELMGVPAVGEGPEVSPRAARLVVTGAVGVLALILVAAILVTSQRPASRPAPGGVRVATRTPEEVPLAEPQAVVPAPGRTYAWTPVRSPRPLSPARQPARQPSGYGVGQWVGPGTFMIQGSAPAPGRPRQPMPPVEGAVPYTAAGPPTVSTPGWGPTTGLVPVGARLNADLARRYYLQGDHQRAIAVYEHYLRQNPDASAAPREELAWVYAQAGQRESARGEYRAALSRYQEDLSRGHNVEAARHGVRTCESALAALEIQ